MYSFFLGGGGGFNPLWGMTIVTVEVACLRRFFNDIALCILNDDSSINCHPASGTKWALDLSVADPSLFLYLTWTVVDDLHGSDHFHVIVQFSHLEKKHIRRRDFKNVNWNLYSDLCISNLTEGAVFSTVQPFTNLHCLHNHTMKSMFSGQHCSVFKIRKFISQNVIALLHFLDK